MSSMSDVDHCAGENQRAKGEERRSASQLAESEVVHSNISEDKN